ncbi:35969_t:CDS:10 [Gigaspora margarita]|uniref:35969_t:CDS:1 n=1 Tax=Gigaspora margarita TaxID=4874 RepID=A0ABN7UU24_GIGMA|nr:35969_t:CDS:10 [Gigaspora margarita]
MSFNEEIINSKIKDKENQYDLTVISNVNKQMGAYVETTTSLFTKQLLECAKETPISPKRVAKEMEDVPNNPFIVSETTQEINLNDHTISGFPVKNESYNPSSDNLDDDTFVEPDDNNFNGIRKRSQYNYDWFMGPGIVNSALSVNAKKWFINALDVSSLLLKYRDTIVKSIFDTFRNEFASYSLSDDEVLRCYKMAKCKLLLRKWQKNLDDDKEDLILETFESMQGLKEDSFVHEVYEPVIRPFFLYAMDLKYEAIYRMILLGKFYLPRDNSDLGVLSTSIKRLMQIKTIMACLAEIVKKKNQNLFDNKIIQNSLIEMTRPSFIHRLKFQLDKNCIKLVST